MCRDQISVAEINALFIFSGCEQEWWVEPAALVGSSRVNRVNGWFAGIQQHAPDREIEIVQGACERLLAKQELWDNHRQVIEQIRAEITGVPLTLPRSGLDRYNLHPTVCEVAGGLFANGHYRQAVLDVYIALISAVKEKSGRLDLDGSALMQQVFSVKNPTLSLSDSIDEQQGCMWLFSGAAMAIRNPRAHTLNHAAIDQDETLELLALASLLFRWLERCQKDA